MRVRFSPSAPYIFLPISDKQKIVVIVGPTASGKSGLAIELAKKYNGEVVSADSRQVYKGLNIGTGKVTKKEMSGVRHHMLDVASPNKVYTVSNYTKDAEKAIQNILVKNKVPIICGGTGFYIDALIYGTQFPEVGPNKKLREKLSKLSAEKLFAMLSKKDPVRAKTIDQQNKVRLIRALEIVEKLGFVPETTSRNSKNSKYNALIFGIKTDSIKLKEKIRTRLLARIKAGMIRESTRLHAAGLSWKRTEALGLEYRYISRHLRGLISKEEMVTQLETEIWHYAKRQMTWFKKNKEIRWMPLDNKKLFFNRVRSFIS